MTDQKTPQRPPDAFDAFEIEEHPLVRELRAEIERSRTLYEVGTLLTSTMAPEALERRTIEAATKVLDCEVASLLLIDRAEQELYFEVALGDKGGVIKTERLRLGEGIAGWVAEHGEAALVPDCDADPRFSTRMDQLTQFITRDVLAVPVKMRGEVIGVLEAINHQNGRSFDETDQQHAEYLASSVAVAVENARMFEELNQRFLRTISTLAQAIELRDPNTGNHIFRVTQMSVAVGRHMGLDADELETLRQAAALHDVGKIGVDDEILRKPAALTPEEFQQMQKHPELGVRLLADIPSLTTVLPAIRGHHERMDGTGYPDGLAGEEIPLLARIICVTDAYDAITSRRPYSDAETRDAAMAEIRRCTGTQFDPAVVEAFEAVLRQDL